MGVLPQQFRCLGDDRLGRGCDGASDDDPLQVQHRRYHCAHAGQAVSQPGHDVGGEGVAIEGGGEHMLGVRAGRACAQQR